MASGTKRRAGLGRGLAAILPETPADAAAGELRELPVDPDQAEPEPATHPLRSRRARRARRLDRGHRRRPAAAGPPPPRRQLRAGRRRAPLARRPAGGPREGPGGRPRPGRAGAAAGGADREHGARGPQPGRGGESLRRPGRGPRPDQRGAGAPGRPQPPRGLQPDPPARAPRRGARDARKGRLSEGHGRALLGAPGNDVRRRLARDAVAGDGRSARPRTGFGWPASQKRGRGGRRGDPDERAALRRRRRRARGGARPRGHGAGRRRREIASSSASTTSMRPTAGARPAPPGASEPLGARSVAIIAVPGD